MHLNFWKSWQECRKAKENMRISQVRNTGEKTISIELTDISFNEIFITLHPPKFRQFSSDLCSFSANLLHSLRHKTYVLFFLVFKPKKKNASYAVFFLGGGISFRFVILSEFVWFVTLLIFSSGFSAYFQLCHSLSSLCSFVRSIAIPDVVIILSPTSFVQFSNLLTAKSIINANKLSSLLSFHFTYFHLFIYLLSALSLTHQQDSGLLPTQN